MFKTIEDFQKFSKDQFEAATQSATALSNGMQQIVAEATDFSKKSFETGTDAMQKLFGIKSFESAIQLQMDFAKAAYESAVSEATKIGGIVTTTTQDVLKPHREHRGAGSRRCPGRLTHAQWFGCASGSDCEARSPAQAGLFRFSVSARRHCAGTPRQRDCLQRVAMRNQACQHLRNVAISLEHAMIDNDLSQTSRATRPTTGSTVVRLCRPGRPVCKARQRGANDVTVRVQTLSKDTYRDQARRQHHDARGPRAAPGGAARARERPSSRGRRRRPRSRACIACCLLNDDYTPMEFVVVVLRKYFNKIADEATHIMLHVHHHGVGECGVFTYEVAETKVTQVMDFARKHQHPLQCIMEKK